MRFESVLRCDDCGRSLEQAGTCPVWCRYTTKALANAHYDLVKSVGAAFVAQHNTLASQDAAAAMDSLGSIGLALETDCLDNEDEDLSRAAAEIAPTCKILRPSDPAASATFMGTPYRARSL